MALGLKSSADRYGTMVVSIHWLSALLIVILIASGFRAANTVDPAAKAAILGVYVPIAITMLALTVVDRLVVRLRSKTQSDCWVAALAGEHSASGASPHLRHHPRNDREWHMDDGT